MSLTDESDKNVIFEPEGTEGDDEGTEPERSPRPSHRMLPMTLRQQNSKSSGQTGDSTAIVRNMEKSPELCKLFDSNVGSQKKNHGGNAKKRRRGKKRHNNNNNNKKKWKPYTELTWEERKEVDDREAKRAAKKRQNRPTPYNTTQFLMEDHKVETPDFSADAMVKNDLLESSDDAFDDNVVGGFHEKDFTAVYNDFQSERLQNMSKKDLVSEVLALSSKVNELEGILKLKGKKYSGTLGTDDIQQVSPDVCARLQKVRDLEETVSKLREENSRLQSENQRLLL